MKNKQFVLTAVLVVVLSGFSWMAGYAAGREGEGRNMSDGILVATGFVALGLGLYSVRVMWLKNTAAPTGVSAWRFVLGAVAGVITGVAVYTLMVKESSDSFNLGVVMAVTLGVVWLVRRISLPSPTTMQPTRTEEESDRAESPRDEGGIATLNAMMA